MHDGSQADPHDPVDRPEHQHHARALGVRQQLSETEDHAALVLGEDLNRGDDVHHDDGRQDERR